jgi:hypothetical protein
MDMRTIKKRQISTAALIARETIPGVDEKTIRWLLELVEVSGELTWITRDELKEKMRLLLRYIPGACGYSLLVLAELIETDLTGNRTPAFAPAGVC